MHVHLVLISNYRRRVFDNDALAGLRAIFDRVPSVFAARLIEYLPKAAVSNLVNSPKGVSSQRLRKERPDIGKRC